MNLDHVTGFGKSFDILKTNQQKNPEEPNGMFA